MQVLLGNNNVEVNARDIKKRTPLHIASKHGIIERIRVLSEHRADANARDILHRTPLHLATKMKHFKCAVQLLQLGADADSKDIERKTALHYIASDSLLDAMTYVDLEAELTPSIYENVIVDEVECCIALIKAGNYHPHFSKRY